jgi:hypothetical protein
MSNSFQMSVKDVFRIGKHTVFVGPVEGASGRITRCKCDLVAGGELVLHGVTIEHEDLFTKDEHSLRTLDEVDIDRSVLKRSECRLVCSR